MNPSISIDTAGRGPARLATLPPLAWLALQAAALWPHWRWAAARVADGSDDPLGLAALAVLLLAVARMAPQLQYAPRPGWLAAALAGTLLATAAAFAAPPLFGALLAALALAAGLRAFMPAGAALLPLAGLAVLALPVVSSLQFYAGFPLRVLTAEASTQLLQLLGLAAQRSGTAMLVEGRLIIVDAPCSGVQMVWMAYFCACAVAALGRIGDAAWLRRLPWVGVLVLCGNVLRNSVLVALEAQRDAVPEALHQGVGVVVLALVCAAVVLVMRRPARAAPDARSRSGGGDTERPHFHVRPGSVERPVVCRHAALLPAALLLCACALLPMLPSTRAASASEGMAKDTFESPAAWDGKPLRPLALSAEEQRFAARFPGRIERLTDGEQVLVLRQVRQPTRMLHPAADCYRGLGYRITQAQLERDAQQRLWRCFIAERDGRRSRVCERIVDAQGGAFTDASSWFWAAQLGRSTGPWLAVTTARAL